jgi:WD40 repeat protein
VKLGGGVWVLLCLWGVLLGVPAAHAQTAVRLDAWGDPLPPGALFRTGTLRAQHEVCGVLRFSPDGKLLAAPAEDLTIRLWEAATGKEVRRFTGHEASIWSVAFSADGKLLVSSDKDHTIRLWDVASGRERRRLDGPDCSYHEVFLHSDATSIGCIAGDEVRFWDAKTGKETRRIPDGDLGSIRWMIRSADGQLLVAGCENDPLRLWGIATGKELRQFRRTATENERPIFLSRDGTLVTVRVRDNRVTLWELASGKEVRHFGVGGLPWAVTLAVSPDGKFLASGDDAAAAISGNLHDVPIRLWELSSGKEVRRLRGHQHGIAALAFSPDSKTLASLGSDSTLRQWDVRSGEEMGPVAGHQNAVLEVAFSPDGKLLASGGADRTVRLWDPLTGKEIRRLRSGEHEDVRGIAFLPAGILLALHEFSPPRERAESTPLRDPPTGPAGWVIDNPCRARLRFWESATGREVRGMELSGEALRTTMALSPASDTLAVGGLGEIRLLDAKTAKERTRLGSQLNMLAVALSPDARLVAATNDESVLRPTTQLSLYEVTTGREVWRKYVSREWLSYVAFSPDGKTVATGGDPFRLWDVATGTVSGPDCSETEEHVGISRGQSCVAFSPDGRMLATGREGVGIILWEVATRKPRRRFAGHLPSCLAFSPDGRLLASGGRDTLVMAWGVTGSLLPKDTSREAMEKLWARLGAEEAAVAYDALCGFLATPGPAIEFLRQRLPAVSEADRKRMDRLVAELDNDAFAVREKAAAELAATGVVAEPALRRAMKAKPSAEVRQRAGELLRKIQVPDLKKDADYRRDLRLVEALEYLGTAEAEAALRTVAEAGRWSRVQQEANEAVARLAKRAEARGGR